MRGGSPVNDTYTHILPILSSYTDFIILFLDIVGPSPSCLPVLEENKVTQSTAPDLIPTIDRLMEQDKIKELAAKEKVVGPDTPNGKEVESESETNAAKRLGSLVDYDSDSDDEPAAETEDMQPQAKKIKAT